MPLPEFSREVFAVNALNRDAAGQRSGALDALRGLAILAMVLSGLVPQAVLPTWMYHAQLPPPEHTFDGSLPGLTWVDLVFPFFLFALGAALPLALTRRLDAGHSVSSLAWGGVRRGLLLLFFAVFVQHINPYLLAQQNENGLDTTVWQQAMIGFGLLFPILIRLPKAVPSALVALLRLIGFAGVFWFMFEYWYREPILDWINSKPALNLATLEEVWLGFKVVAARSDIILAVLAHCVTAGTFIWLITRHDPAMRVGWMVLVLGCIIGAQQAGWIHDIWHTPVVPKLVIIGFLKYLAIVIPGTIVGDLLVNGPRPSATKLAAQPWPTERWFSMLGLLAFLVIFTTAGLHARYLPATPLMTGIVAIIGFGLFRKPGNDTELVARQLYGWGVLWLIAGLAVESFQGGIKKDQATISYYLVTSGLSIFTLIALKAIIDILRLPLGTWVLRDNGQNPMIAYVGMRGLVAPLLALTGASGWLAQQQFSAWGNFGVSVGKTLLLALIVVLFSRLRIFWRT